MMNYFYDVWWHAVPQCEAPVTTAGRSRAWVPSWSSPPAPGVGSAQGGYLSQHQPFNLSSPVVFSSCNNRLIMLFFAFYKQHISKIPFSCCHWHGRGQRGRRAGHECLDDEWKVQGSSLVSLCWGQKQHPCGEFILPCWHECFSNSAINLQAVIVWEKKKEHIP